LLDQNLSPRLAQLLGEAGHRRKPSLILFRRERSRRPEAQATLILSHIDRLAEALDAGAIVVIEESRMRIRPLPVIHD
jgi:predicted nuclease of predicted toxin-antitoxin system